MERHTLVATFPDEIKVLREQGRLDGHWVNVKEHCITEARAAAVLASLLGLKPADTWDLIIAALLHDWNKRNEREAAIAKGHEAYNEQATASGQRLREMGYSERVVRLTEAVGHAALNDLTMKPSDFLSRVAHYLDTITQDDRIVTVDERMDALEAAPRYKELNESGRAILAGRTYFDVQREVGKAFEKEIQDKLQGRPVVTSIRRHLKQLRHFVCFPCADPKRGYECAVAWKAKGYEPLVMAYPMDWRAAALPIDPASGIELMEKPAPWPGYYQVINDICAEAFRRGADLVTCIGDDMDPPEQGAAIHSEMYFARFAMGLGVMQCTGDRQGEKIEGRVNAERICGSPTFGKAWNDNAFLGAGPFGAFPLKSYYGDELLHEVALKMGLLYQEPELRIDHRHWSFGRTDKRWWHDEAQKGWLTDQAEYFRIKAEGFKGCELIEATR